MNNMDFFDAIGFIDEQYVLEAKRYKNRRKNIRNIFFAGGVAASFVLFILLGRIFNLETANESDDIVMEKQSATDYTPEQYSENEKATTNEAMDNLNQYFSENGFPNWFGGYYLEQNTVYVSLVELNADNKLQVQAWAKSGDMIFTKAKFSYNELNNVMDKLNEYKLSRDNAISNNFNIYWLSDEDNCVYVELNDLNSKSVKEFKENVCSSDAIEFLKSK